MILCDGEGFLRGRRGRGRGMADMRGEYFEFVL